MKKILVPLTLSSASHAALAIAGHFAQACDATVVLLHVVQRGPVERGGTGTAWALSLNEARRQAEAQLNALAAGIRPCAPADFNELLSAR